MKKNINKKLAAGFGFCLLLIVTVVGFNYSAFRQVDKLFQETSRRSEYMELATDAEHVGAEMYVVIANAVINRNLPKSEQEWAKVKKESLEKVQNVAEAVDTPEEHANVRKAQQEISKMIRIFEQDMMPLVRDGASVPGPITAVDAHIDERIAAIDLAMQRVGVHVGKKPAGGKGV